LTKPFYCGKFEVTQDQWQRIMGDNPSNWTLSGKDAPVERVSWEDCQRFLSKLCQLEEVPEGTYTLLSEAQWEYACRAGTQTAFCYGNDLDSSMANVGGVAVFPYDQESQEDKTTISVGHFKPNAWGLYDMHGNVLEWCQDMYDEYPTGSVTDPFGPPSSPMRPCRGGARFFKARNCRSATRDGFSPDDSKVYLGLRLMRTIPQHLGLSVKDEIERAFLQAAANFQTEMSTDLVNDISPNYRDDFHNDNFELLNTFQKLFRSSPIESLVTDETQFERVQADVPAASLRAGTHLVYAS